MPTHNPDCTHGGAHAYSACRNSQNQPLKMLEDPQEPISTLGVGQEPQTGGGLTEADREALRVALAGLVPSLGADHDPYRDPDADADAAQRAE